MAKSYSLRSVVAIAIPLGVVCLVVLVVSVSIFLKYSKLSARRQAIEQRIAKGDLRRHSASGPVDSHDSHNTDRRSRENRVTQATKHLTSYEDRGKPRRKSSKFLASSYLAVYKENLRSTAPLRYLEKDGSISVISVLRSPVIEQSVSNNANGPNGEPNLDVRAKNRLSNSQGVQLALSQPSPSPSMRETIFSNFSLRRQSYGPNPHAFLIESGLGSAAELVNYWDSHSESHMPSPPVPPYRSLARSSKMADRHSDLQFEIQPATPQKPLGTANDVLPPPKSALRSERPISRFSSACSRKHSSSSISPPSLQSMRNDKSRNRLLTTNHTEPPGSKASPLLGVSIPAPPKQRPRLSVATPIHSISSIPPVRPLTSISHGEISSIRTIPTPHDQVKDRALLPSAKQKELSIQSSLENGPNDGTDELLRMTLYAYEEKSKTPFDDESIPLPKETNSESPAPNCTDSSELLTGEIDTISAATLTRETKYMKHTRAVESLAEQSLLPQNSDVLRDRIMKTLQNDEDIHEGSERVDRAHVDDGNSKHSLRGSVVESDSTYSRSRANSAKRHIPTQPSTGHDHPAEALRLSTTSSYERNLGKIDSSTAQFKEWLAAAPGYPKPTPLPSPSAIDTLKTVAQQKLLVEQETSSRMKPPQLSGQKDSEPLLPKSHTATKPQDEIIDSAADHNNIEQENGEPLKGVKLQSSMRLSISADSSLSRSSSRAADSLLADKQLITEQRQRPPEATVKQVSPLKPESKSNNHEFSESIRKIASSLHAPSSPRSPGYQPGQQLDTEPVGNAKSHHIHPSQGKKFIYGHSMSNAENRKLMRSQTTKLNSLRVKSVGPGKVNNHTKKALNVNKPLPMTPSVLKGGVVANLRGARFVVTVPHEGNLSDELDLHYNDVVEIYEVFDDGWCLVRIAESAVPIANSDQRGVCPKSCLVAL